MVAMRQAVTVAVVAASSLSSAHMVMRSPKPYGSPNNSPVEADGSNFPCKATSNSDGPVTEMAIGAPQTLSFTGSAVHGGGSCQVSLTTDNPATRSSKWQVIHSILGGCPARGAGGNLQGGPGALNPDTYQYSIPAGISPGTYTLAWTWFNRIGNRELYMNCANIKVTSGNGKRDVSSSNEFKSGLSDNETVFEQSSALARRGAASFPDMFIANIPTTDCVTPEMHDTLFPHPGSSVEKAGVAGNLAPPTGPKCNAGAVGTAGGSGGSSDSSSVNSDPLPSNVGGIGAPVSSAKLAASATVRASSPRPSAVGSTNPANPIQSTYLASSPAQGSSFSASGSTNNLKTVACSPPGKSVCSSDAKSVGMCDLNHRAVLTPVPAGTVCKNGFISWPRSKRSHMRLHQRRTAAGFS